MCFEYHGPSFRIVDLMFMALGVLCLEHQGLGCAYLCLSYLAPSGKQNQWTDIIFQLELKQRVFKEMFQSRKITRNMPAPIDDVSDGKVIVIWVN